MSMVDEVIWTVQSGRHQRKRHVIPGYRPLEQGLIYEPSPVEIVVGMLKEDPTKSYTVSDFWQEAGTSYSEKGIRRALDLCVNEKLAMRTPDGAYRAGALIKSGR